MDEGRKRVVMIMAALIAGNHIRDLNERSPATEAVIANAIRIAERIVRRVDSLIPTSSAPAPNEETPQST